MKPNSRAMLLSCVLLVWGCDGSGQLTQQTERVLSRQGEESTVQVFMGNGHTQCANDALSLAQTQMILVQGGIDVLGSSCGVIVGIAFPAVCGAGTGEINIHRVRRENVGDAERLGFRNVSDIGVVSAAPGTGFQEVHCDTRIPLS